MIRSFICAISSLDNPETSTVLLSLNPNKKSVLRLNYLAILTNISMEGKMLSFSQLEMHCLVTPNLDASST